MVLLPFLFGIAFLYFLINIVRYFIIGGASDIQREKARLSATYGVAAFVFIFSLWGIVSLFVNGLDIEENTSLCPDYLKDSLGQSICGNKDTAFDSNTTFPVGKRSGGNSGDGIPRPRGGTGSGINGGIGSNGGSGSNAGNGNNGDNNISGLAELVFGTGKDSAVFLDFAGNPRAQFQTPIIEPNTSCSDGMNTLLRANRIESSQAAYLLYQTSSGVPQWKNVTDLNSANHISYDEDILRSLLATDIQKPMLIHSHPRNRVEALDLTMAGHGPSSADMKSSCSQPGLTYGVVDWSGVWTFSPASDTCPYSDQAKVVLPLIETYVDLASVEASTRKSEITQYVNSPLVPSTYKDHFAGIDMDELSSYTSQEVLALSSFYQSYASTTLNYQQTIESFCLSY